MREPTMFDEVGKLPFFERLVDRFYDGVAGDPVLLALYPESSDLTGARRRLTLFLVQYWGGPTTYSDERGHPRLRARHHLFPIGIDARDRWLTHMRQAIEESGATPAIRRRLLDYVTMSADAMRNIEEPAAG